MNEECENKKDNKAPISNEIAKRFLDDRKIFLWDAITDETAAAAVAKLLYLDMLDHEKEITFYISTPGGSISAGMSIYDTMKLIKAPVKVVVTGIAMSMGSILLSAAPKGKRFLFPSARVMIHQPYGGATGQARDVSIAANEILRWRAKINEILSKTTGKPVAQIEKDSDRDFYMTAEEALKYGIVDKVIESKRDV